MNDKLRGNGLETECGVPGTKRWEEETRKGSSDICLLTSLPLIHRAFARGLLWQRQSQIGRKWIRVTSRVMATTQFGI